MKILFIYQGLSSFIKKDLDILSKEHEVCKVKFTGRKNSFFNLLPNVWKLARGVMWCDITFSWFGKLHAFFAVLFSKLLKKKSIVVAGGDDVVYAPEINYGMFSFWWKKWCPLFVYKYTDLILPPSEFHNKLLLNNAKPNPRKVKVITHGFDYSKFKMLPGERKNGSVITVGGVTDESLYRKGLKLFVEAAAFLPNMQFILIGPWYDNSIEKLKKIAPDNVTFMGGVYGKELIRIMSRASAYIQVSEYEGFGCSLAEAMLCECVPVVSRKTAIPMVVGNCGVYVDELIPENIAEKIKYALSLPHDYGKMARNRIIEEFPLNKRKTALLEVISKLVKT